MKFIISYENLSQKDEKTAPLIISISEENAIEEYKKGLSIMDEALRLSVHDSDCTGPDWDKARLLYNKMESNKVNIQSRLGKLGKCTIRLVSFLDYTDIGYWDYWQQLCKVSMRKTQ